MAATLPIVRLSLLIALGAIAACDAGADRPRPRGGTPIDEPGASAGPDATAASPGSFAGTLHGPAPAAEAPGGSGPGGAGGGGGEPPEVIHTAVALVDTPVSFGGDALGTRPPLYTGMGGGVALLDLDGDGDLDVLLSAERGELTAFRNDGSLSFTDVTAELGLGGIASTTAFALGDCDGDGDLEILVSRSESNVLLDRGEDGLWHAVEGSGLDDGPERALSADWVDLDGDGDLDVFQTVYMTPAGGSDGEFPHVYLNDGSCHFTRQGSTGLARGLGVDVALFDADDDGDPDALVANDFGVLRGPTVFHENRGGTFLPLPAIDGAFYGMGATVADLDHDGRLDVYVTNVARNPYFRNVAPLQLVDDSARLGIGHAWYQDPDDRHRVVPVYDIDSPDDDERRMAQFVRDFVGPAPDEFSFLSTSWSASAVDLDADGLLDLFLTNGRVGVSGLLEGSHQRLALYRQEPLGTFREISADVGFQDSGTFKGSTVGDLDADGLPDIVVFDHNYANLAPRHRVLRNASTAGHWVRVKLSGKAPNTWGIGAVVRVDLPDHPVVQQRTLHGGVYSASADSMFFGIGGARFVDIRVTWPWRGGTTVLQHVSAGSTVTITQE